MKASTRETIGILCVGTMITMASLLTARCVDARLVAIPEETILVGTGCEGPSPIAVAREEDCLPYCADIQRHTLSTEDPTS
jgi:hypothetical protein